MRLASAPKQTRSTPASSPASQTQRGQKSGLWRTKKPSCFQSLSRAAASSSRCGQPRSQGSAALLPRPLRKSIERIIKALDRELASLDGDIDGAVRASPVWREKEDLLSTVPGIGPAIARTLIAELPELGTLGRKRIGFVRIPPYPPIRTMARKKLY